MTDELRTAIDDVLAAAQAVNDRYIGGSAASDSLARKEAWRDGPYVSKFGDGNGDPYVPVQQREVWGTLGDGRVVWADGE